MPAQAHFWHGIVRKISDDLLNYSVSFAHSRSLIAMKKLYIGCSGYYYPQWKEKFYPPGVPQSKWLDYYSRIFNSVELNGTFYRTPKLSDLKRYAAVTPEDFIFSVKASRYITHVLKMKDTAANVRGMTELLEAGLGYKFASLLFQFPATFKYTPENLELLVKSIPSSPRNVIEFRHSSWWNSEVESTIRSAGYTFCNVDYPGLQPSFVKTSSRFYLRLHGVPELFKSAYTEEQLDNFRNNFPADCDEYFVYFNNTYFHAAYTNALMLMKLSHLRLGLRDIA